MQQIGYRRPSILEPASVDFKLLCVKIGKTECEQSQISQVKGKNGMRTSVSDIHTCLEDPHRSSH